MAKLIGISDEALLAEWKLKRTGTTCKSGCHDVGIAAQVALLRYIGSHPRAEDMSRHAYDLDGPMFDELCATLGVT